MKVTQIAKGFVSGAPCFLIISGENATITRAEPAVGSDLISPQEQMLSDVCGYAHRLQEEVEALKRGKQP